MYNIILGTLYLLLVTWTERSKSFLDFSQSTFSLLSFIFVLFLSHKITFKKYLWNKVLTPKPDLYCSNFDSSDTFYVCMQYHLPPGEQLMH